MALVEYDKHLGPSGANGDSAGSLGTGTVKASRQVQPGDYCS